MTGSPVDVAVPASLRCAVVVGVTEDSCDAWTGGSIASIRFAPLFPSPRIERVQPGHLVAVATSQSGNEVIVWRWFDAVVLGAESSGLVPLWEPAHGDVAARPRPSYQVVEPGQRAYASAGLPGAEWWIAGPVVADPAAADVDLDDVDRMFTSNDLWIAAFGSPT